MPSRNTRNQSLDMLGSIAAIREFLDGYTLDTYQRDLTTKSAVERQLQILTEAAYRLKDDTERLCPQIDRYKVRGLGNFLRHEYHNVNPVTIWNQISDELPLLQVSVQDAIYRLQVQPE